MHHCTKVFALALGMALLCACGEQGPVPDQAAAPATPSEASGVGHADEVGSAAAPSVTPPPTRGGDGSQIELLAVSAAQLETVDLQGELACTFEAPTHGTLLLARADVLPDGMVRAVVNNNGYAEMLANGRAGGFNDLLDGVTLTGKGLVVRLERGAAESTSNESTRHAATLTVQRADGAERTYDGTWTCGP